MDLWIRSQDKEMLVKCNCIDIMWVEGIPNIFVNEKFPDYIVANYTTKERALEVLDEIQKLLTDGDILLFKNVDRDTNFDDISKIFKTKTLAMIDPIDGKPEVSYINKNCIVYEMPKE